MPSIYLKLVNIQNELKAPKSQYNNFGKYNYRNQEDILEAAKPLLLKHGLTLIIKDNIELIGERYYVKATCILIDTESGETLENTALARESVDKKGMDDSQVTGSTSSYARKYALNGLFLIDDTKDADSDEYQKKTKSDNYPKPYPKPEELVETTQNNTQEQPKMASENQVRMLNARLVDLANLQGVDGNTKKQTYLEKCKVKSFDELTSKQIWALTEKVKKYIAGTEKEPI
jgi:hypothetical protein